VGHSEPAQSETFEEVSIGFGSTRSVHATARGGRGDARLAQG
jgi:hypothetical protein